MKGSSFYSPLSWSVYARKLEEVTAEEAVRCKAMQDIALNQSVTMVKGFAVAMTLCRDKSTQAQAVPSCHNKFTAPACSVIHRLLAIADSFNALLIGDGAISTKESERGFPAYPKKVAERHILAFNPKTSRLCMIDSVYGESGTVVDEGVSIFRARKWKCFVLMLDVLLQFNTFINVKDEQPIIYPKEEETTYLAPTGETVYVQPKAAALKTSLDSIIVSLSNTYPPEPDSKMHFYDTEGLLTTAIRFSKEFAPYVWKKNFSSKEKSPLPFLPFHPNEMPTFSQMCHNSVYHTLFFECDAWSSTSMKEEEEEGEGSAWAAARVAEEGLEEVAEEGLEEVTEYDLFGPDDDGS